MNTCFIIFLLTLSFFSSVKTTTHRRNLHQPLFPATPTPSPPPPSSSQSPPSSTNPFFHENTPDQSQSPPPPPVTAANTTVTHPIAPQPANKSGKKIAVVISVGIVTLGMLSALAFFIYKHKSKQQSESRKLVGVNSVRRHDENDESPRNLAPSTFLYIGTVEPSRTTTESTNGASNGSPYNKLNSIKRSDRYRPSPELQPLPPLIKPQPPPQPAVDDMSSDDDDDEEEDEINDFYTPQGSIASTDDGFSVRSFNNNNKRISRRNSSPIIPHSKRTSPKSRFSVSSSPDTTSENPNPANSPAKQPTRRTKFAGPPPGPDMTRLHSQQKPNIPMPPQPPPPPPPEKPGAFPMKTTSTSSSKQLPKVETKSPSAKVIPKIVKTKSYQDVNNDDVQAVDVDGCKPKLKPLHWDKVRATSDRATVWDQLKSSSFQ